MLNQNHRPEFNFEKFQEELFAHRWSFTIPTEEDSFYNFRQAIDKEKRLFDRAMQNGIQAVTEYKYVQRCALQKLFQINMDKEAARIRKAYDDIRNNEFPTGDEKFDEFRKMVINFDSTYEYSDDIRAYRAGKAQETAIKDVLNNATSPKYYEFYQYYLNRGKTINQEAGEQK